MCEKLVLIHGKEWSGLEWKRTSKDKFIHFFSIDMGWYSEGANSFPARLPAQALEVNMLMHFSRSWDDGTSTEKEFAPSERTISVL